jgi:QueT transporter
MPLSILFGWPAVLGVTLGAGIGNFAADSIFGLSGASIGVDVVGGSLANLVAAMFAWKIAGRNWMIRGRRIGWLVAVNTETIIVSLVVGTYLGWLLATPWWVSFSGILAGSIAAISIGGYAVLRVLGRPKTLDALASTGLLADQI